ncbi:MAG: helix-turn-helix transcriptional regulator [Proteiniphilum sp.]|uniref:response regulator transcription factor n=1 Tax=Proteiniphilum sp. TaxID=1926877 RepID=UPI002ABC728E|nr:helix-turn-helix transcriptional regulator [Proteiniphilum sp.]MDY9918453.1 helix-turn-helix transcriptional regulator [Proteiniphilum sp.]
MRHQAKSLFVLKSFFNDGYFHKPEFQSVYCDQCCCQYHDLLLRTKKEDTISLSRREHELLRLIAEGHTMNTISEIMCIGYETVKSYRKNIMTKLQVPNTAALIKYAVERKIV